MLTTVLILVLALLAFAYVVVPLLIPGLSDPLPDDRDPRLLELQEERDALFRAIRELDARTGMSEERLDELRQRYEAKAAKTLSAIDARTAQLARLAPGEPDRTRRVGRRSAVVPALFLAIAIAFAVVLPSFVLPRVGQDATITTTDVQSARRLQELRNAAASDPSPLNVLALGDFYVEVGELAEARATYVALLESVVPDGSDAPEGPATEAHKGALQRLAMIDLQSDLASSFEWLKLARAADPRDPDTLTWLTEVAYALGDLETALDAGRALATVRPDEDPQAALRLSLLEEIVPLTAAVATDPSRENLMALADSFWRHREQERAIEHYFQVLSLHDPLDPLALGRTGQVLLRAGRPDDAVLVIERAVVSAGSLAALEPDTQFALGNGYLALGDFEAATSALTTYLAGSPADPLGAGVLLAAAQARARGEEPAGAELALGQQVFSANCAICHGADGSGGVGARLSGNPRAANVANVTDAVRFGRGLMPAFQATLGADQLSGVVAYVTQVLATSDAP